MPKDFSETKRAWAKQAARALESKDYESAKNLFEKVIPISTIDEKLKGEPSPSVDYNMAAYNCGLLYQSCCANKSPLDKLNDLNLAFKFFQLSLMFANRNNKNWRTDNWGTKLHIFIVLGMQFDEAMLYKNYDKALQALKAFFNEGMDCFEGKSDKEKFISEMDDKANALLEIFEQQAIKIWSCADKLEQTSEEEYNKTELIESLYSEAIKFYNFCLTNFTIIDKDKLNDILNKQGDLCYNVGLYYKNANNIDDAKKFFTMAIDLYNKAKNNSENIENKKTYEQSIKVTEAVIQEMLKNTTQSNFSNETREEGEISEDEPLSSSSPSSASIITSNNTTSINSAKALARPVMGLITNILNSSLSPAEGTMDASIDNQGENTDSETEVDQQPENIEEILYQDDIGNINFAEMDLEDMKNYTEKLQNISKQTQDELDEVKRKQSELAEILSTSEKLFECLKALKNLSAELNGLLRETTDAANYADLVCHHQVEKFEDSFEQRRYSAKELLGHLKHFEQKQTAIQSAINKILSQQLYEELQKLKQTFDLLPSKTKSRYQDVTKALANQNLTDQTSFIAVYQNALSNKIREELEQAKKALIVLNGENEDREKQIKLIKTTHNFFQKTKNDLANVKSLVQAQEQAIQELHPAKRNKLSHSSN